MNIFSSNNENRQVLHASEQLKELIGRQFWRGAMETIWPALLALLFLAAPAAVQAQFTYSTNAGVITLTAYSGSGGAVVISNFVTIIGNQAFYGKTSLTSVTIPSSVTSIESNALTLCTNLTSLMIPGSLASIGYGAFEECSGLTNVTISNGVTSIGEYAFGFCTSLTSIMIPNSVTNIGDSPFGNCKNLTAITVDAQNSLYSSTNGVLFDKNQTTLIQYPAGLDGSYIIPGSVTNIGDESFSGSTNLTSVTIPNGIISIGEGVFYGCSHLTGVTIPGGVANIGAEAFVFCANLTTMTIPYGVTNIGVEAFDGCTGLTSVYFAGNAPSADSTVFSSDGNVTAYYLPGTSGWGEFSTNTGVATVLWNPLIQANGLKFGVRSNQFGFNITGTNNFTVVVEACTNLANPVWTPLQTLTLTNGSAYFSDPQWTNYPVRFYGLGFP